MGRVAIASAFLGLFGLSGDHATSLAVAGISASGALGAAAIVRRSTKSDIREIKREVHANRIVITREHGGFRISDGELAELEDGEALNAGD